MKQRSASYPYYSIKDSLDFSEKIYKNYGTGYRALREQIADALNYSVGSLTSKISSAVQYGLLDMKSKEGYQVTELFVQWFRPVSEKAKQEALLESFKNPSLYSDLIEVFQGGILPPLKPLANILLQQHSISEKACDRAAEIFEQNALLVSVLEENSRVFDVLNIGVSEQEIEELIGVEVDEDVEPIRKNQQLTVKVNDSKDDIHNSNQTSNKEESRQFNDAIPYNIPLKGKRPAQLLVPGDIQSRDFEFIIDFITLMKRQYE